MLSRTQGTPTGKAPNQAQTNKGADKGKDDYIAVRWPATLRQALKVAAAGNDPPLTMTEYLAECFNDIQDMGGLRKVKSSTAVVASDKQRRKRYQEVGDKLFRTRDRRLIDSIILLIEYATR